MWGYLFGYTVACLLALPRRSFAFPSNTTISFVEEEYVMYQEYVIEHDISTEQARNAALAIDLRKFEIPPPGCQKCTTAEINYCKGNDFISDHCCCDKRYNEVLPFIPHTCYLGVQLCKPIVDDCTTYKRLRLCCCNAHVIKQWKSGACSINKNIYQSILILLLFIVYF